MGNKDSNWSLAVQMRISVEVLSHLSTGTPTASAALIEMEQSLKHATAVVLTDWYSMHCYNNHHTVVYRAHQMWRVTFIAVGTPIMVYEANPLQTHPIGCARHFLRNSNTGTLYKLRHQIEMSLIRIAMKCLTVGEKSSNNPYRGQLRKNLE